MISAGTGFAMLAGRNRTPKSEMNPPRVALQPATTGRSRTDLLSGEWRTSLGLATFKRQGDTWVVNFANQQLPALEGLLKGKELTLKYDEVRRRAASTVTLDDSGRSFSGPYTFGEGQRNFVNTKWEGWRPRSRGP